MDGKDCTTHICYLSLGSNLGDRLGYFRSAKRRLKRKLIISLESSIYETEPWGFLDQPKFFNQVIQIETKLTPVELLKFLKDIERRMGRQKTILFGPRIIDLDILFYDQEIIDLPELKIPHPAMADRAFILIPLAEIAADTIHPVHNITVTEMLTNVDQSGIIKYNQ